MFSQNVEEASHFLLIELVAASLLYIFINLKIMLCFAEKNIIIIYYFFINFLLIFYLIFIIIIIIS